MTDTTTDTPTTRLFTPTRIIGALAVLVALLAVAVFVQWRANSSVMTIDVDQPVGATVFCRFVVDGRPELRTCVVPVTYEFPAAHLTYAIIGEDVSVSNVRVLFRHSHGAAGSAIGDGVQGECRGGGFASAMMIGGMSAGDVASMRSAMLAEARRRLQRVR